MVASDPAVDVLSGLTADHFAVISAAELDVGLYQVALDGSGTLGTHLALADAGAFGTQVQWKEKRNEIRDAVGPD